MASQSLSLTPAYLAEIDTLAAESDMPVREGLSEIQIAYHSYGRTAPILSSLVHIITSNAKLLTTVITADVRFRIRRAAQWLMMQETNTKPCPLFAWPFPKTKTLRDFYFQRRPNLAERLEKLEKEVYVSDSSRTR